MAFLPWTTWRRLIVWFVIGIIVYAAYGHWHSRLHLGPGAKAEPRDEALPE